MDVDKLNNLIEESRKLSGVEIIPDNWIPKVGDWVVLTKSRDNWNEYMDSFIHQIVQIQSISNASDYKIKFENITIGNRSSNTWAWIYTDGHFRKALFHEIPK